MQLFLSLPAEPWVALVGLSSLANLTRKHRHALIIFRSGNFLNVNSFHFLRSQWRINVGHSNPWSILSDISCRWSSSCSTVGNGNQLSNATKPWNLPKWRCKRLGKKIRPETTGYVCGVFSCAPHNRVPYFLMKLRKNCGRSRRNPKKLGQQQRGVASKFATTKAWQKMRGLRCAFKIVYIWLYDGVFSNYCTSVIACSFPDGIAKFQHGRLVDATLVGRETWTTD